MGGTKTYLVASVILCDLHVTFVCTSAVSARKVLFNLHGMIGSGVPDCCALC